MQLMKLNATNVRGKDEEDVSLYNNEVDKIKVLMALANDENVVFGKESTKNDERVKISMRKCISEQIPIQKKIITGVDQLTEDPSSSGKKDLVFVKSLADDTKVSIPGVERSWLSKAEGFILPNHDTGRILPAESQIKGLRSISSRIFYFHSLNTAYWSSLDMTYWILFPSWYFVKCRHRYAVSSLMDTAYWVSERLTAVDGWTGRNADIKDGVSVK
uniref:Uncharacterized protein n=1 Tax=Tanacetum cinerariifolium TaxID=118510 RepID=A0A699GTI7_TANCI|nr:hypothetical protein [Tanacetum cinerariifolium]